MRRAFVSAVGVLVACVGSTGCAGQYYSRVERGSLSGDMGVFQTVARSAPSAVCSREELDDLLAPIALYPDALLAQVLPASTRPEEVVLAARWVERHGDSPDVDVQGWDPSVIALAHYPSVLTMMDERLDWTVRLGRAFLADEQGVMDAVQRLRARARTAGTLCDTEQQVLVVEHEVIRIVPARVEYVYVPTYTPTYVYSPPALGCEPRSFVRFSVGFRWGSWLDRDCDWRARRVCRTEWKHDRDHAGHDYHGHDSGHDGGHDWHGRHDHDAWHDRDARHDWDQRQDRDERGGWSGSRRDDRGEREGRSGRDERDEHNEREGRREDRLVDGQDGRPRVQPIEDGGRAREEWVRERSQRQATREWPAPEPRERVIERQREVREQVRREEPPAPVTPPAVVKPDVPRRVAVTPSVRPGLPGRSPARESVAPPPVQDVKQAEPVRRAEAPREASPRQKAFRPQAAPAPMPAQRVERVREHQAPEAKPQQATPKPAAQRPSRPGRKDDRK